MVTGSHPSRAAADRDQRQSVTVGLQKSSGGPKTGHHARMSNDDHRCWKCDQSFVPDPRIRERQVTCGKQECQQARHADRREAWRERNAEITAAHYQDVVKPFRQKQPDYQKRWRLKRPLREIREKFDTILGGMLRTSIRALLGRVEALSSSPTEEAQTGVLAGDLLDKAARAVRDVVAALEQLGKGVATLRSMGL